MPDMAASSLSLSVPERGSISASKVMWAISWDETTSMQVGNQAAISAVSTNGVPAFLTQYVAPSH